MKKLTVLAVLVAVFATILASVTFSVNSRSVNNSMVWMDGSGSPVPPMPTMVEPAADAFT
jgi:hypothetical protein